MKRIRPTLLISSLVVFFLIGCSQISEPIAYPSTTIDLHTQTPITTQSPISSPTLTPETIIDMGQFQVQIDELICSLKEVEFYGLNVFQADCEEEIYLAQAQAVTVTLLPPDGQLYPISPIPDQEAVFGALEPPFVYGEFVENSLLNTALFSIPMFKFSGEPILCGFSIPYQGEDVYIVITGLTTRAK